MAIPNSSTAPVWHVIKNDPPTYHQIMGQFLSWDCKMSEVILQLCLMTKLLLFSFVVLDLLLCSSMGPYISRQLNDLESRSLNLSIQLWSINIKLMSPQQSPYNEGRGLCTEQVLTVDFKTLGPLFYLRPSIRQRAWGNQTGENK